VKGWQGLLKTIYGKLENYLLGKINFWKEIKLMPTIEEIVKALVQDKPVRIILTGPAGIGKTYLASKMVKLNTQIKHIEHDQLKKSLECSISYFDLEKCFEPEISNVDSFVIDVAGGSIFRKKANNKSTLRTVIDFKLRHYIKIILLNASRDVVKTRYLKSPGSFEICFSQDWKTWLEVGQPNWKLCCDLEIDVL